MQNSLVVWLSIMLFWCSSSLAQSGNVRGVVREQATGNPILFANIIIEGSNIGAVSDENGIYNIIGVPVGSKVVLATVVGFEVMKSTVTIEAGKTVQLNFNLVQSGINLGEVVVNSRRQESLAETQVSTIKIDAADIKRIPTIGGEADLAQYLQVIPGVISTGDQGGQLFIRGGAPIQNKVMLDNMTLYNAFHSVGLFSVYETEVIRSVEVLTGGFGAEFGGRISAVVDVQTRDGNKKRTSGSITASPFVAKMLLEGPLRKLDEAGSSISYMLTAKHSYLDRSSKLFYQYVENQSLTGDAVLPYGFTDVFAKLSFNSPNGSKVNLTAFNYNDNANFAPVADYVWNSVGAAANFTIIPGKSPALVNGRIAYSDYGMMLNESVSNTREAKRESLVSGANIGLDITYFLAGNSQVKYGLDVNIFRTFFEFTNPAGIRLDQDENTIETAAFFKYRKSGEKFIIEPSIRLQYYASLGNFSPEPRLSMKYNVLPVFRLKAAAGLYSQNLISTKSERDVVDLFTGFLSGPEGSLNNTNGETAPNNLQKAFHLITGIEYDLSEVLGVTVEPYYKRFTQLINLNRNKVFASDPNYQIETGNSYGIDFSAKYNTKKWYLYGTYSLGYVDKYDGEQTYNPYYDRRHNFNFVGVYSFGAKNSWEISMRWNLGSGFPFNRIQGFYPAVNSQNGVSDDIYTQNPGLGVIYESKLNQGRLPYYHRLDLSVKKSIAYSQFGKMEIVGSVTNVYNRQNLFYINPVTANSIYQLPVLPSLGFQFTF